MHQVLYFPQEEKYFLSVEGAKEEAAALVVLANKANKSWLAFVEIT